MPVSFGCLDLSFLVKQFGDLLVTDLLGSFHSPLPLKSSKTHFPKLHAAQGRTQHCPPQVVFVGHKHAVQRVPSDLDDVAAEGIDNIHQVRIVAVYDL